jgi:hypothetical protein
MVAEVKQLFTSESVFEKTAVAELGYSVRYHDGNHDR